jgi:hypothetical protein
MRKAGTAPKVWKWAFLLSLRGCFPAPRLPAGEYDVAGAQVRVDDRHFEYPAPMGAIQNKEETNGSQESVKETEEVQETQLHEDPERNLEEVRIKRH